MSSTPPAPPGSAAEAIDGDMHESEVLDYKATMPGKELAKRIAAMANANGGLIILGVKEITGLGTPEKPICGLVNPDGIERDLALSIKTKLSPNPATIQRVKYDGKDVLEIHVAKKPCIRWDKDTPHFDIRVGSGTEPMTRADIESALKVERGIKVVCSIAPVSLHTSSTGTSVNLRLTITNDSSEARIATSLKMRISSEGKETALWPLSLFDYVPNGWVSKSGSVLPIPIPAGATVSRDITSNCNALPESTNLVALSGTVTVNNEQIKIPQVFANTKNRVVQTDGRVGFNLVEIDEPTTTPLPVAPVKPSALLVPELHSHRVGGMEAAIVPYCASVFLFNSGQTSAKEVRVQIEHTENNSAQNGTSREWKNTDASGRLNPRTLKAEESIHAGERRGTFEVYFKDEEPENIVFRVQIWCLDQPPTKWRLEVPRKRLLKLEGIQFVQEE